MTAWTQHAAGEWHSTSHGYGVAAWETGWAVYVTSSEGGALEVVQGAAESLQQAKGRALSMAEARRDYDEVMGLCEVTR